VSALCNFLLPRAKRIGRGRGRSPLQARQNRLLIGVVDDLVGKRLEVRRVKKSKLVLKCGRGRGTGSVGRGIGGRRNATPREEDSVLTLAEVEARVMLAAAREALEADVDPVRAVAVVEAVTACLGLTARVRWERTDFDHDK
jgi:hypothetical protein